MEIRVARIFNTYGPGMKSDDGRVVSNFVRQALEGKDLTIYGDGGQTRSFCFVSDLIDGIRLVMDHDSSSISPVNLGNPNEISMSDLAHRVINLAESDSQIINLPLPSDDPLQRCPDISKMQSLTGWSPTVHLDDGLSRTIEFARDNGWIKRSNYKEASREK